MLALSSYKPVPVTVDILNLHATFVCPTYISRTVSTENILIGFVCISFKFAYTLFVCYLEIDGWRQHYVRYYILCFCQKKKKKTFLIRSTHLLSNKQASKNYSEENNIRREMVFCPIGKEIGKTVVVAEQTIFFLILFSYICQTVR